MTVSAQSFRDIFNDAVKDNVKRATEAAALYNSGAPAKAAYRAFRTDWDSAVDAHRATIRAQLQNPDIGSLYKKLARQLDDKKFDADAVKMALDALAEKVATEAKLTAQLDVDRIAMMQTMNSIKLAEGGMRRFPQDDKIRTRQTHDKLLDQGTLHQLEEAAETNRDNYLDLAQRALEKTIAAQDGKPTRLQVELSQYLDARPATSKPLHAPATARFIRKPQVKP